MMGRIVPAQVQPAAVGSPCDHGEYSGLRAPLAKHSIYRSYLRVALICSGQHIIVCGIGPLIREKVDFRKVSLE